MLAEVFMLRMEANLRNARTLTTSSDTRLTPIDLKTNPKPSHQIDRAGRAINHNARQPSGDDLS